MTTLFREDTSITIPSTTGYLVSKTWIDYNNDSKLDFILTDQFLTSINGIKLYKNTGNGFTEDTSVSLPAVNLSSLSVAWTDYNNDDKTDLLFGGYDNNNVYINKLYKGTGSGFIEETSIVLPLPDIVDRLLAWADYNNDSKPDFIVTGYDSNYTPHGSGSIIDTYRQYAGISKLYKNTGSGFIEDNSINLPGVGRRFIIGQGFERGSSVEWADYNNDSKPDFFLTGYGGKNERQMITTYNEKISKFYKNTGTGFVEDNLLPSGISADPLSWADYNNDSKPDLLLTDGKLYQNTGNGLIEDSSIAFPGTIYSAGWTDYNNDSKLDVFLTGVDNNGVQISKLYLNNSTPLNGGTTNPPIGGGDNTDNLTGNVMRFWNEQNRAHFFTANPKEVQDILNNPSSGYQNEGNEFDVPKADASGTLAVYRYKNQKTSTYFYTFQVPSDITPNYPDLVADGIAFNAYTSETKPADAIPIYRFWNEGRSAEVGSPVHFFTSTESNKQDVIDNFPNFKYEEAGFYAYPANYF